jgi:predicted transcriptional regulator
MESFLRESPRTVSQIIKARIMPQGSVVYVLRRMLLKGTVTKDGAIYSLKVGV